MGLKLILAPAVSLGEDEAALKAAHVLAGAHSARAAALVIAVHPGSDYAQRTAPLSEILADIAAGSRGGAARERAAIAAHLDAIEPAFELRDVVVEAALTQKEIVAHARCADLVVMSRGASNRVRRVILEAILFDAGRPLLLMPSEWRGQNLGERVLIGWNASREAVRAVNDALPVLKRARQVVVATVDARPSASGHGEAPGRELAAHLARHGVSVDVRNLDGMGRPDANVLMSAAFDMAADMMVIGAYGRSRAEERMFGGVTRDLLIEAQLPLFMSH